MFLKFFEFLKGKNRFTYEDYLEAFENHFHFMDEAGIEPPQFMGTPEEFIQFMYEPLRERAMISTPMLPKNVCVDHVGDTLVIIRRSDAGYLRLYRIGRILH